MKVWNRTRFISTSGVLVGMWVFLGASLSVVSAATTMTLPLSPRIRDRNEVFGYGVTEEHVVYLKADGRCISLNRETGKVEASWTSPLMKGIGIFQELENRVSLSQTDPPLIAIDGTTETLIHNVGNGKILRRIEKKKVHHVSLEGFIGKTSDLLFLDPYGICIFSSDSGTVKFTQWMRTSSVHYFNNVTSPYQFHIFDHRLVALKSQDEVVWEKRFSDELHCIDMPYFQAEKGFLVIYAQISFLSLEENPGFMVCLRASDGSEVWRSDIIEYSEFRGISPDATSQVFQKKGEFPVIRKLPQEKAWAIEDVKDAVDTVYDPKDHAFFLLPSLVEKNGELEIEGSNESYEEKKDLYRPSRKLIEVSTETGKVLRTYDLSE